MGWVLGGENPHSKDETIELSSLAIASKRAAIFMKRYATNFL
jgi:di/tripeptidase